LQSNVALPYFALDLLAAVLDGGVLWTCEEAWTVTASRRLAVGLHDVVLPGRVLFAPYEPGADLYASLGESRTVVADDPDVSAVVRARREQGVKGLNVSAAYGNFARVDRKPLPEHVTKQVEVIDPWGRRILKDCTGSIESPGPDHSPLLAGAVTATTRFVLALIDRAVRDKGGIVAQTLVDAVTIPAVAVRKVS
jgi:hypothetical protein